MIKSCYIDGCAFERDDFPEGLYVYQTVITFGHEVLHLGEYLCLLKEAAKEVLRRALTLDEKAVAAM
ncbi:MAG: hypothetical protein IJF63_08310, partial [Alistipes sp.]|nr:hypothetical protein [Alistipes sp.]